MTLKEFCFLKVKNIIELNNTGSEKSKNKSDENTNGSSRSKKILVCDEYSLKIMASIAKMKEIIDTGVVAVLPLEVKRQPMNADVIYLIDSTDKESRKLLLNDFHKDSCKYRRAYVYSVRTIPDEFISEIKNSHLKQCIKGLSEVHLDFLVKEDRVFTINYQRPLKPLFNGESVIFEHIVNSLFSLFVSLKVVPEIRLQSNSEICQKIGSRLNSMIESVKNRYFNESLPSVYSSDARLNELSKPIPTILLLCERSFDPITPFLHELTFQSMAADVLSIKDNIYEMSSGQKTKETIILDSSSNEVWSETRHKHIADVLKYLPKKLKEVASQKKMNLPTNKASLKDLRAMLAKLPQHKAELTKYQVLTSLAEECYMMFENNKIEDLCKIEQDLATGLDKDGEKVNDPLKHMINVLASKQYSEYDRLRLVLLYALSQSNGVPSQYLEKVLEHGKIMHLKPLLDHFVKIGFCVLEGQPINKNLIKRARQFEEGCYSLSRYQPTLRIVMDEIVSGKNPNEFTILNKMGTTSDLQQTKDTGDNFKFGKWKDKAPSNAPIVQSNNKRLVVFVAGGISYSEIRSIYQLGVDKKWETIAGSTHILSPESFLDEIKEL